jgi:hypothetical protein
MLSVIQKSFYYSALQSRQLRKHGYMYQESTNLPTDAYTVRLFCTFVSVNNLNFLGAKHVSYIRFRECDETV